MTDLLNQLAALDPAQRAALEQRLRSLGVTASTPTKMPVAQRLPLTPAQQGMWFTERLGTGLPGYNIVAAWRIDGQLEPMALQNAWAATVSRHPVLRTVVRSEDEMPYQEVLEVMPATIEVTELTEAPGSSRDDVVQQFAQREIRHRFALTTGPLARLRLLVFAPDDHRLILNAHHLLLDGWSLSIVLSDFLEAYAAIASQRESALPPLENTFGDFVAASAAGDLDAHLAYWRQALDGMPQTLELPADRQRPAQVSLRGQRETFWLGTQTTADLKELAREQHATLFTVLLSGLQALLSRYTGADDIAVGTPISIRPDTGFDGVAGLFLNTVVLRGDVSGDPSFAELIGRTTAASFEAFDHRVYPFERLADQLATARDLSRNPLFQVLLVLQNTPAAPSGAAGIRLVPMEVTGQVAKFDLSLAVTEHRGELRCDLDWATDLFDVDRAQRLAAHFRLILDDAVAHPQRRVSELSMLTVPERALLRAWNRTDHPVTDETLSGQFARVSAENPERQALCFDGTWQTYAEVAGKVNQLARRLQQEGIDAEQVAGVCLARGNDLVISLHAILAAGGAYLPLDPDYPVERLRFMVRDAAARVVICTTHTAGLFADLDVTLLCLDSEKDALATLDTGRPTSRSTLDSLAYVIYTSGSTGEPKGAGITQRAVVNRLAWMHDYFPIGGDDRVLQKTPMSFDVSVWEFFWPLCVGAALVVAEPGGHRDSGYLVSLMERERITTVHFVPSMLDAFCEEPGLAHRLTALRRIFASGEALPGELAARCLRLLPQVELHNLYGPTEAAVDVTWQPCRGLDLKAGVPIGKAVYNTTLEVLDTSGRRAPVGIPGELCLAGVQLARGYLGRPALTAERFVPYPWGPPGSRLYRTGDLARWLADGSVEYLGRLDHQVKVHGFRIELGEIEAVLTDQPEIRAAVVMVRGDGAAARLVAYVVTDADEDWMQRLRQRLPQHMVPDRYVRLGSLPVTRNGKLDRAALPDPFAVTPNTGELPAPGTESVVASVWSDVLDVADIRASQDFFALGGDSIRSLKVAARLRAAGWSVSVADVFAYRTVREIAVHLDQQEKQHLVPASAPKIDAFGLLSAADQARLSQRNGESQ